MLVFHFTTPTLCSVSISYDLMIKLTKDTNPTSKSPQQPIPPAAMADAQQPPAMEPPAYTPPEPTRPHRSIADLRAQIIANGSVIRPRNDVNKSSDDHIELIVAKTPAPRSAASRGNPRLHWNEKEAMSAFNRGSDPMRASPAPAAADSSGTAAAGQGQKHYALLMKRSGGSRTIYIIGMHSSFFAHFAVSITDRSSSTRRAEGYCGRGTRVDARTHRADVS